MARTPAHLLIEKHSSYEALPAVQQQRMLSAYIPNTSGSQANMHGSQHTTRLADMAGLTTEPTCLLPCLSHCLSCSSCSWPWSSSPAGAAAVTSRPMLLPLKTSPVGVEGDLTADSSNVLPVSPPRGPPVSDWWPVKLFIKRCIYSNTAGG
eukprot:GHRR01014183.1.p1 GENE.GHRR01014183.1~~GHRR01014183.1.p1  ORF type:complete len:151 (+),score=31.43 GHRR01014183.1:47-499(+)